MYLSFHYCSMRYVAAYLLAVLGGKESPVAADLEKILSSVGVEVDQERLTRVVKELAGKSIEELIAQGREKLQSVPSGGAVAAAPAAGSAAPAAAEKKEEKGKLFLSKIEISRQFLGPLNKVTLTINIDSELNYLFMMNRKNTIFRMNSFHDSLFFPLIQSIRNVSFCLAHVWLFQNVSIASPITPCETNVFYFYILYIFATAAKKEESEEEEDDDMGFGLFE